MPRCLGWILVTAFLFACASARAIELYPDEESFINRNVVLHLADAARADAEFAEHTAKLDAADAGLAYAERGHRLYLRAEDGSAGYAAALRRDPKCHLAEVYHAGDDIDREDYEAALQKLHPDTDDAPEGVEWGMYALALQLRGHPADRAKIREALETSRSRSRNAFGYETLRAWVLVEIEDGDYAQARRWLTDMSALDSGRSDFAALEERLQAYETEQQLGNQGRIHELLVKAAGLREAEKFAEALAVCVDADAIAETDAGKDEAARINLAWGEALWTAGKPVEASAKIRTAMAMAHDEGLRTHLQDIVRPMRADALTAYKRGDFAAAVSLGDTAIALLPHDHELGVVKAVSLMELHRYPESIRAWIDIATQEEAPDRQAKIDYDHGGLTQAFIDAYTALQEADKAGTDSTALCAQLVEVHEAVVRHKLDSAVSHLCLGVFFERQGRAGRADAEWNLARAAARPEEKARLEELIQPYVARRTAQARFGPNLAAVEKYGTVLKQLFDEWAASEQPDFSMVRSLEKKLGPVQRARLDEIVILIGQLHQHVKDINDLKHQARVTKDVYESTQQTQEDLDRGQRSIDRKQAEAESLAADGRRLQALVEQKMENFWRP